MAAVEYAARLSQGDDFVLSLLWEDGSDNPIDLTGWEARFQLRPGITADAVVTADSTGGDVHTSIVLGGVLGTIVCTVGGLVTSGLAVSPPSGYVYALSLKSPGGGFQTLIKGTAQVAPGCVVWP